MPWASTKKYFSPRPPYEVSAIGMNLNPERFLPSRERYLPLLQRLEALFDEMDRAYSAVADQYGFHCSGCADNCCLSRFAHHTLLEYLYLVEGMGTLETETAAALSQHAVAVAVQMADVDRSGEPLRSMCPLNRQGRCLLYRHRPMICRLHGIPHELRGPAGSFVRHPGCDVFFDHCRERGQTDYIPFDRTPYYRRMAMLEQDLRRLTGYTEKIKLTVAQALATLTERADEIN